MCRSGEFADRSLALAKNRAGLRTANGIAHRDTATAYFLNSVVDCEWPGITDWLPEPSGQAVHDHVDIFVALNVKVIDPQKLLKKLLLRTLEVQQVAGVMQQAEAVEFVEVNLRYMAKCIGHDALSLSKRLPYNVPHEGF